tara:strand:- start:6948 stop:8579 length:1632 start_codon:yes stop_codon:yes gene_type:complete
MKSRLLPLLPLVAFLSASHTLHAQNPPKGFEKVDQEIVISTLRAAMKYDVRSFSVKPGAKVKLTLRNPDDLPHNLIICTPGKSKGGDRGKEVIDAVIKLGAKGVEMNWEPKGHPRILHSSGMVQPKKESVIWFKAPKKEGNYPYICSFPGHFELMNGMMAVSKLANPVTNLTYSFYHGSWDTLPDFSKLEPKKTGTLANGLFDLSPRDRSEGFGFVFTGDIECPKNGTYSFELASDDGSRLYLDGKMVVNNDGIHGHKGASGKVKLTAGRHKIEVRYFEKGGEESLYVGWAGPGVKKQSLSRGAPAGGGGGATGIPIVAEEGEAAIYRNFIADAGPRAIGVGYDEAVNLTFDANNMRLAQIWQGDFMDGARHWNGRGQGFQPPAGEAVIKLPPGVAFAVLSSPGSAWPKAEPRTKDLRFRGYRLGKQQHPTFRYERGSVSIEDTPAPVPGDDANHLKRTLKLSGSKTPDNLYFRAASGDIAAVRWPGKIKAGQVIEVGGFLVNDELIIIVTGGKAYIQGDELRVPVAFRNGSAQIEVTYQWAE